MRVFLDANVMFSAAWRPDVGLRVLWQRREMELVTSPYAIEEARRNLPEPAQLARLEELAGAVGIVPDAPGSSVPLELPEKDRPILAAAIMAGAAVLLTGDGRHFGPLFGREIGGVRILTPAMLLRKRPEGTAE